ncbi:MAG TPA: arsenate reductase ArsC [Stellaceae bacterium]|nr:arsenate reductase ArsC [Stellaceae bacterium]HEV2263339.1 arsenate reductase ArsC [Stellaceae bacterium]
MSRAYNVLFLCTGNSARSVIGEVLLNHWGKGRFHAYSAGSQPKDAVNPLTLELLHTMKLPTSGLRSKSWNEFARSDAPQMDFVFTVCDQAAAETCPVWPGQPITAHWGVPDPAAAEGTHEKKIAAFRDAFQRLDTRIKLFLALPLEKLDRLALQREARRIGALHAPKDAAS